jgi:hypothetical protein
MCRLTSSREPQRWPVLAGILGLLLLAGCAAEGEDAGGRLPDDCRRDGPCPLGQVCNVNGRCVPEVGQPLPVGLRITPPAESGLLEEHRTGLRLEGDTQLPDLVLSTPTRVSGNVTLGDVDTPAPARMSFRRLDGLGGVSLRTDVLTDARGYYDVALVPGRYRVTVTTDDAVSFPPFRIEELAVSGASLVSNIALGDPSTYYRVRGRLVRQRAGADDVDAIAGAMVVLQASGSGAVVSTSGETARDTGEFTLTARPLPGTYVLRVGPSSANELVPSLALGPLTIDSALDQADGALDGSVDLGELIAGEWADPVAVAGAVLGENGASNPVPDATIFFERSLELGSFSLFTRAAQNGTFVAQAIPGSYRVTVVPPADSTYGATAFGVELDQPTTEAPMPTLHHKPVLSGVVRGPDGAPVADVTVTAEPTGFQISSLSLGPSRVETDADGRWELPVHAGSQRLRLQPRGDAGLAPVLADLGSISGDTRLEASLVHASTLSGVLRAPDGAPIAGATVEAFLEVDGGTALSFGSTSTDERGYFVVNLPTLGL